jgi:hypothetical protein
VAQPAKANAWLHEMHAATAKPSDKLSAWPSTPPAVPLARLDPRLIGVHSMKRDPRTKAQRKYDHDVLKSLGRVARTRQRAMAMAIATGRDKPHVTTKFRGAMIDALPESLRGIFKTLAVGDEK